MALRFPTPACRGDRGAILNALQRRLLDAPGEIHPQSAAQNDGLAGPVSPAPERAASRNRDDRGGAQAPYVVERWTKLQGSELDLYYTMSTLNPYVVVLMKSRLQVE